MSAPAIPPSVEPELLAKAGEGWSTRRISEWLATEKGVTASHNAVAKLLAKARQFRADVTKVVVREKLQQTLTPDLDRLTEIRADLAKRAQGLLDEGGKLPKENHLLYLKTIELESRVIDRALHYAGADSEEETSKKAEVSLTSLSDEELEAKAAALRERLKAGGP
jgi:hypothetical protein